MGEDGEATAEGRITLEMVRRTLGQLSEEQRSVLVLVCVDGLTYKEAAAVLGIPLGTVMSRLSRARQELHARLTRGGTRAADSVAPFSMRAPRGAPRPD